MACIDGSPIHERGVGQQAIRFKLDNLEKELCNGNVPVSVAVQIEDPSSLIHETTLVEEIIDDDRKVIVSFCWYHPEVQKNWKTVLGASMLFLFGSILIALGCFVMAATEYTIQGVNFFIGGLLCFIPGSYHICYIWLAARGYPGFEFQHLQVFT